MFVNTSVSLMHEYKPRQQDEPCIAKNCLHDNPDTHTRDLQPPPSSTTTHTGRVASSGSSLSTATHLHNLTLSQLFSLTVATLTSNSMTSEKGTG
ncbi:hypothetical protein E2C01_006230 [Portunus trituberculatus]|uniref:Uncharacterized protein n=1 Tax=Portunus trituberculatus TaxID=210409 RepID=A0A5B7CUN7_PORTR|nr:hypothetical protein [Portunus trituberculatus]